jgi:hypothetical protein
MVGSTKRPGGQGVGCLLFFAILWSAFTLVFDYVIARAICQQIQALTYSTAIGTITSSEVEANDDGEGTTYRPDIKYTYEVGNQRYEGDRYRYGQINTGDYFAHQIVASFPVGSQVEVYHAPNDPADAVLQAGLEGGDFFDLMFILPFNLIMLMFWLMTLDSVRHRLFRPVAGGARVSDDGGRVRVRLSPWRPTYIGAAVSGGLAFILVFVVGFSLGHNPPVAPMIVAWGTILGGGGMAGLYVHRKLARGESDLLIDDLRGSVVLPRTCGRQEAVVVSSEKIVLLKVEQVEKSDSDGYIPTVVFTDDDGSQRQEKLIEWSDEHAAEGLVEWLSERLRIERRSEAGGANDDNPVGQSW